MSKVHLENYTGFFDLFKKIPNYNKEGIVISGFFSPSYVHSGGSLGPNRILEADFIFKEGSPFQEFYTINDNIQEKLNYQSAELVIAAAIDRNIVVYDTYSNGDFTDRLKSLLIEVQQKNSVPKNRKLTDIFIREGKFPEKVGNNIPNWHLVPDEVWDEVEEIFFKYGGSLYTGTYEGIITEYKKNQPHKNLVIAISNSGGFIHPVLEEKEYGLGILTNEAILLGSF